MSEQRVPGSVSRFIGAASIQLFVPDSSFRMPGKSLVRARDLHAVICFYNFHDCEVWDKFVGRLRHFVLEAGI